MSTFWRRLLRQPPAAEALSLAGLGADMHSHLLPGLDDGAATVADSLDLLRALRALGFRKLVLTPHIMGDFYRNTPAGIRAALAELQAAAAEADLGDVALECAAEYYLDEFLGRKLADGTELLTFGGEQQFLLFETSYLNEPLNLLDTVFELQSRGYRPVLAHPERYAFWHGRPAKLEKLRAEHGVLLQLNLNSLAGYYAPAARHAAEYLVDAGLVDFVGTDSHHLRHTDALRTKTLAAPYLRKLLALPLLNATL